jgi:hypothetical protein
LSAGDPSGHHQHSHLLQILNQSKTNIRSTVGWIIIIAPSVGDASN